MQLQQNNSTQKRRFSKEEITANFYLFAILVCGLTIKDFHKQWVEFRRKRKRSLILAPRDHGKSLVMTVAWTLWRLVNNPNLKIIIAGNSAGVAQGFLAAIKSHIEKNAVFKTLYGDLRGELWNKDQIMIKTRTLYGHKEPTITAVGAYGSIVSGHYDILLGEDLVDFENSRTQGQRDKLWDWFMTVLYPTIETSEVNEDKEGEMHFLGTRYHYDDMYGRFLGEIEKYAPGMLRNESMVMSALQGSDKEGWYALWPERKSAKRLLQIKADVGSVIFALQYQNNASMTKGSVFMPYHFGQTWEYLPEGIICIGGYDLAVSQKTTADYFAECVLYMDKKKNLYVDRIFRGRMTAPKQYEMIKSSHIKYKFTKTGVESVAYQEALAQWLRENTDVPVRSVKRSTDKVMRAYKILPLFENNKVFFKKGVNFGEFIDEMILFDGQDGKEDDMFDAFETAASLAVLGDDFKFWIE